MDAISLALATTALLIAVALFLYRRWRHSPARRGYEELTPYDWTGSAANTVKITIQMMIGIGLAILILIKLFYRPDLTADGSVIQSIAAFFYLPTLTTLEIVGRALAYSTAIELAYTLFTPGPDEAVEPLILGVAAAMLLSIGKIEGFNLETATGAAIFTLVLMGLFHIRKAYIKTDDNQANKSERPIVLEKRADKSINKKNHNRCPIQLTRTLPPQGCSMRRRRQLWQPPHCAPSRPMTRGKKSAERIPWLSRS